MMYDWNYGGGGHDWAVSLVMIMWWVLVLLGTVLLVRYFLLNRRTGGRKKPTNEDTALDILNKHYASGEIDKKEYQEKRKAIEE